MSKEKVLNILPEKVQELMEEENLDLRLLQEIKLRKGQPLMLKYNGQEKIAGIKRNLLYYVKEEDIRQTLDHITNYSLYAYEEEIKQGFLTMEGGHRVGIAGQTVIEKGKVKQIKHIASLNIRFAHEIIGCADPLFPYITGNRALFHTLIISPPGCGKTTMLRDLVRQISNGNQWIGGMTVGVVDERSEIAGCYMGVSQNHLGMRTDVLDGCPKGEGMIMLIRSMDPQVIAVDEIGAKEDVHAITYAMYCGCKLLATVHGNDLEEVKKKPFLGEMILEKRFERYIVLENTKTTGRIKSIHDKEGKVLFYG